MITMKNRTVTRELYVSDISFQAEEEDLRKLFVLFGAVTSIHMVKDPKSGRFKGSAFVRMATPAQARDALARLGHTNVYILTDGLKCVQSETMRQSQGFF